MADRRLVVVGTTPDYIDLLCRRFPGRSVFLTDPRHRTGAVEPAPDSATELLCDLGRSDEALAALRVHLNKYHITPSGIACFDCESMSLTATIANALSLPYPSGDAIAAARSKFLSKQLWHQAGLPCPGVGLVSSQNDATLFQKKVSRPIVMKPLTGSGSELVFKCSNASEIATAFTLISTRLAEHHDLRMYATPNNGHGGVDPRRVFAVEEYIEGPEYSCDFIIDADEVEIIRITRKIPAPDSPLGTILGYELPAGLPKGCDLDTFRTQIGRAAQALGISRAIVMLDFIVRDGRAVMIEMTPRPGGDCLPPLILQSSGFDILGAALDFGEGKKISIPDKTQWNKMIGVRLFAQKEGTVASFDTHRLDADPRVRDVYLKRRVGHQVILPPKDYDSRLIGHVIFEPTHLDNLDAEALEIAGLFRLEMEKVSWAKSTIS
jgi:biotin carboxylase